MNVLGIIPARKDSKRVINKNLRLLGGKPLIQHTIEQALESKSLDRFIVSTDSEDIVELSMNLGANAPFIRPTELATDEAADRGYLLHAVEWLKENEEYEPDAVMILRPTAPLRATGMIDRMIADFSTSSAESMRGVTRVEGVFHPFWMFTQDSNGKAKPLDPENSTEKYYQSQLLPPVYRLNGVVDIISTELILNGSGPLYGDEMHLFECDARSSMDIDTEDDLIMCESMLKQQSGK